MAQPRPTMPTMFEEFSFMGHWWRPEEENKKWAGQVTYEPESGIELEIMEEKVHSGSLPLFPLRIDLLHGTSPHFPYDITLVTNQWLDSNSLYLKVMSGSVSARYRSKYFLAGHHFTSTEDIILKSVKASFSNLRGWMWTDSPFSLKEEGNKMELSFKQCLKHIPVELDIPSQKSPINSTLILSEIVAEQQGPSQLSPSDYQLERACFIHLEPSEPQSLTWFQEQIDGIRDLLEFLTGMYVETKSITAKCACSELAEKEIDIYHFVRPNSTDADKDANLCFPLRVLGEERATSIFETWFDKRDSLWSPVRLCLDVNFNPRLSMADRLVALVRALESLCKVRKVKGNNLLERLKKLYNKLPNDFQDALRLDDKLCSIKNTRNYLVHLDLQPPTDMLEDDALADAVVRLVPFVVYLLYCELDITDEEIYEALLSETCRGYWSRPATHQQ